MNEMVPAEQLVGEARERRARRMDPRERRVEATSAVLFTAVAIAMALGISSDRPIELPLVVGLIAGYALVSRVRFEIGDYYVSAAQLVFVPMLLLPPVQYVPFLVVAALLLSNLPELLGGTWHPERWFTCFTDCWFCVLPVLVVATVAPGEPAFTDVGVYALAFGAQVLGDLVSGSVRDRLLNPMPLWESVRPSLETARVDAVLSPAAFVIGLTALTHPLVLAVIAPLVWLLKVFSEDRQERYTATLELNRAYRGTVMLLADVVEFDDTYTADHSRSVVELVQAVADELGFDQHGRQEIEFAALLHDVGKISIPKEILNKPARLTQDEFEVMKTHTIEGQFMLDRIGGLLGRVGEIVRSCHERWDGGGYPDGLAGDQIPLEARIVFACDAYNAMTTDRPYRKGMPPADATAELRAHAGRQFDPHVVDALVNVIKHGEPERGSSDDVRALLATVRLPARASAA